MAMYVFCERLERVHEYYKQERALIVVYLAIFYYVRSMSNKKRHAC